MQIAWQRLKASRGNEYSYLSIPSFRGELSAAARAHTRDAFVPRQEMSIKTQEWRNIACQLEQKI